MTDAQKADKFKELFGDDRIEWDAEYYEIGKEFGYMSTLRIANIAYNVKQELRALVADAQAKAKRVKRLIDLINN